MSVALFNHLLWSQATEVSVATYPRVMPSRAGGLGSGRYRVEVHRLSPAGQIADPITLPIVGHGRRLSWSRRLSSVSEASVTLAGLDPTDGDVGRVRTVWHELAIYRNNDFVWSGPIIRAPRQRDAVTFIARDVGWRLRGQRPRVARRGAWDVARAMSHLIAQSHPGRTYSVTAPSSASLRVDIVVDPGQYRSTLEELAAIVQSGGVWTAVGNEILAGSLMSRGDNRQLRFPKLDDRHFLTGIIAEERGDLAATDVTVIGNSDTESAVYTASAPDVPAAFRIHTTLTLPGVRSRRDAERAAKLELGRRWPIPVVVSVPPGAALSPTCPAHINHLIPGAVGVVEDRALGGETLMELSALDVVAEDGTEDVKVTLAPTTVAEAA